MSLISLVEWSSSKYLVVRKWYQIVYYGLEFDILSQFSDIEVCPLNTRTSRKRTICISPSSFSYYFLHIRLIACNCWIRTRRKRKKEKKIWMISSNSRRWLAWGRKRKREEGEKMIFTSARCIHKASVNSRHQQTNNWRTSSRVKERRGKECQRWYFRSGVDNY